MRGGGYHTRCATPPECDRTDLQQSPTSDGLWFSPFSSLLTLKRLPPPQNARVDVLATQFHALSLLQFGIALIQYFGFSKRVITNRGLDVLSQYPVLARGFRPLCLSADHSSLMSGIDPGIKLIVFLENHHSNLAAPRTRTKFRDKDRRTH